MKKFKRIIPFLIIAMLFVAISSVFSGIVVYSNSKFNGITIVIDAGHGGRDGGCVGINKTIEKEINLEYAKALKTKLNNNGYKVFMTRETDDGLYSNMANNKKLSDMNVRLEKIKKANPNLVISIHMNSFSDSSVKGASTYYKIDDESSKNVANLIQKNLKILNPDSNDKAKQGDYFILNCSYYTSVLIECGFLSNPNEEKLLNTNEYKQKFVNAVSDALLLYFGN